MFSLYWEEGGPPWAGLPEGFMSSSFDHAFDILESAGTSADIEDDTLMQKPVEDGGSHGLVAGEDAGPVLDALVGGDGGGAASVSIADEPEKESGIGGIHGLESNLVDDEVGGIEVLFSPQLRGRDIGMLAHLVEEVLEPVEGDPEALLDSFDPPVCQRSCPL